MQSLASLASRPLWVFQPPLGTTSHSGQGGWRWWQEDAGWEAGVTACGVNTLVTVDVSAGV